MTFAPNQTIAASDFADLVGDRDSNTAYSDEPSCSNRLAALWGVGFGSYGLGQTVPFLPARVSGDVVAGQDWIDLRTALVRLATQQPTAVSGFAPESALLPGEIITATGYDWLTSVAAVSANRANSDPALMVETANTTSVRTAGWNTLVSHEIEINFGTEDSARFFFNSASQLRFGADIVGGTTPNSTAWTAMLSTMGTVCLGATSTTQTGSGGTGSALGYRNLTTTYQTIFSQSPSAPYNTDTLDIQARVENVLLANGGNGSLIRVLISFNDNNTGTLDGTLTSRTFVYKPDGSQVSIGTPLFTTVQGVDGNPGPAYFVFNQTITTQVSNYNLLSAAQAVGYTGVEPLYANVTVASGGSVISSSTAEPAFVVPVLPVNSEVLITVTSGGVIAGRGGGGGLGAPSGVCGCQAGQAGQNGGLAVQLQYPCLLNNQGIVGGGGGGGGGGGAECSYVWNASAGGGGGGGGLGNGSVNIYGGFGKDFSLPNGDRGANTCGVTFNRFGLAGDNGGLVSGGAEGTRGNTFTANGGRGGDLGQPGQPGQSVDEAGGAGGSAGAALLGAANLMVGSNLGDVRGTVS